MQPLDERLCAIAQAEHNRRFDATNQAILARNIAAYDKIDGPRVGDFLELPNGDLTRFTYDWGFKLQTGLGSFYLGNGYCSFSGSLNHGISTDDVVRTDRTRSGSCWFFEDDIPGAGRGLDITADFRVFAVRPGADASCC
jgi:hypothetical protein